MAAITLLTSVPCKHEVVPLIEGEVMTTAVRYTLDTLLVIVRSLTLERALDGFIAIAPPDWRKPWREVFGVEADWQGDITKLYLENALNRHPDAGGAFTLMAELNVAYAEAKRELGVSL